MRPASLHHWSPSTAPLLTQRWDAEAYVFGLREAGSWGPIGDRKAKFREGARIFAADAADLGLYRPSSIDSLMLHDDDLPAMPSSWEGLSPVGPGDVVFSKFLPVSAAWVSQETPRRPIDANCVRVIGLPGADGLWIANVVEHDAYQTMLAHRAAGATVPRMGLRDLRALRVPETPPEMEYLAVKWSQAARSYLEARDELHTLQGEVETWVAAESPAAPDPHEPRFYAAASVVDSLLPAHLALARFQAAASRLGWRELGSLASDDTERLRGRTVEALRVLRLGDADGRFGFAMPDLDELRHPTFRVYGRPLDAAEVLMSVLGSSPKVVFSHPHPKDTVWLSDHWMRFSVSGNPGALALVLQSSAVALQLELAATGVARQFVPRTELLQVRVPMPDDRLEHAWHGRLTAALESICKASAQMATIRAEVRGLVDDCLEGRA